MDNNLKIILGEIHDSDFPDNLDQSIQDEYTSIAVSEIIELKKRKKDAKAALILMQDVFKLCGFRFNEKDDFTKILDQAISMIRKIDQHVADISKQNNELRNRMEFFKKENSKLKSEYRKMEKSAKANNSESLGIIDTLIKNNIDINNEHRRILSEMRAIEMEIAKTKGKQN